MLKTLMTKLIYRAHTSRYFPFRNGVTQVVLILFYRGLKLIRKKMTFITTVGEITYEVDLHEKMDFQLYFLGIYEQEVTWATDLLCREGMTVLDIGANAGFHTFRFARLVGSEGKVIAFEPMANAFARLNRNMVLNSYNNIILEKLAISNESKRNQVVDFRTSWLLDQPSFPQADNVAREKDVVDFITLDEYLREKQYNKVDLIKIDVDGYELKVIQGAIETLKLHKPFLLLEIGPKSMETVEDKATDLVSQLSDLGYEFYWYSPSKRKIKKYPSLDYFIESILYEGESTNYVLSVKDLSAVHESKCIS